MLTQKLNNESHLDYELDLEEDNVKFAINIPQLRSPSNSMMNRSLRYGTDVRHLITIN